MSEDYLEIFRPRGIQNHRPTIVGIDKSTHNRILQEFVSDISIFLLNPEYYDYTDDLFELVRPVILILKHKLKALDNNLAVETYQRFLMGVGRLLYVTPQHKSLSGFLDGFLYYRLL